MSPLSELATRKVTRLPYTRRSCNSDVVLTICCAGTSTRGTASVCTSPPDSCPVCSATWPSLGRQPIARAYCQEALQLAALGGHDDLTAWVRGNESFLAYYAGRYREALELARDGQRYARGGPQSIRLAASGEARALGRLGDRNGVDEAVNRALAGAGDDPQQERAGCFLSFERMTAPRLAGNAASAYLSLGQPKRVQEFADRALRTFAVASEARASHALTLVDISLSHLMGSSPELEGAGAAMAEAAVAGSRLRSHVVARRAGDFLVSSEPGRACPTGRGGRRGGSPVAGSRLLIRPNLTAWFSELRSRSTERTGSGSAVRRS